MIRDQKNRITVQGLRFTDYESRITVYGLRFTYRPTIPFTPSRIGMSFVLWIRLTVVWLNVVDAAQVTFLIKPVEQPGATFDIISRFRVNPGRVQFVVWPKVKSLDPCQQIVAPKLSPTLQISIADAAIVGINQVKAAMATTVTVKGLIHRLHSVIELLKAKEKSEKPFV